MTNGTERERLMAILFAEDAQLVNIRFFRGSGKEVSGEDVCRELCSAIKQKADGTAVVSKSFNDDAPKVDVRTLLNA